MKLSLAGYMTSSGKTQTEVAKTLGVSRQLVSQYLKGDTLPSFERAHRMRELFGVSVDSWGKPAKAARR